MIFNPQKSHSAFWPICVGKNRAWCRTRVHPRPRGSLFTPLPALCTLCLCRLIIVLRLWGPGSRCLLCSLKVFAFRRHHAGGKRLGSRLTLQSSLFSPSAFVSVCFQTWRWPDRNPVCSGNFLESRLSESSHDVVCSILCYKVLQKINKPNIAQLWYILYVSSTYYLYHWK